MPFSLNRRQFALGTSSLALGFAMGMPARAQSTSKSVTTVLGTYEIPTDPQRVVAIDHRTDLEPALVLGLPVIASGYWADRPWVPAPAGMTDLDMPTTAEHVLSLDPDLIICSADEPDDEWWPANQLLSIAPVLPTSFKTNWRNNLLDLGKLVGREAPAAAAIAEYDALIADIRARHAEVLAGKIIAAVQYFAEDKTFRVHLPNQDGYNNPKGEAITELGITTLDPASLGEYGMVAYESLTDALGAVDGILFANSGTGALASLAEDTFWQRLPAVANGKVLEMNGNTNFGSFYTARHVATAFDELLKLLA